MAVTHPNGSGTANVRDDLATQILNAIDAGAAAGNLVFLTSADAEVATLALSDPAGTVSSDGTGVLTFSAISDDTNATGGTAEKFVLQDSDGNEVFRGTVTSTGGGGDIELDNNVISAGATVSMSSLSYTASV
jgi:hypothetical protein